MTMTLEAMNVSVLERPKKTRDHIRDFLVSVPEMAESTGQSFPDEGSNTHGNNLWHSYRGFCVIAEGLVYNDSTHMSRLLQAGNVKRQPKQKVCAEKCFLHAAVNEGYLAVSGLLIRATSRKDLIVGVSGLERATLPPCSDCTEMFIDHPLVSSDLPIVTMGFPGKLYQAGTPDELQDFYAGKQMSSGFETVVPSLEGWEHRIECYDNWCNDVTSEGLSKVVSQPRLALAALRIPVDEVREFTSGGDWRFRPEFSLVA